MLWKFFGLTGWNGSRLERIRHTGERELEKGPELANASPAFDTWLQAYRNRLEEVCRHADSVTVPAATEGRQ